jgi:hypothetical protein
MQTRKRVTVKARDSLFLSKRQFLEFFPLIDISREEFVKRFKVMYSQPQTLSEIFSLTPKSGKTGKPLIRNTGDLRYVNRDAIIDYFYQILITDRHKYLGLFYEAYFQYLEPDAMNWGNINLLASKKAQNGKRAAVDTDTKYSSSHPAAAICHNLAECRPVPGMNIISIQRNDSSRRLVRNIYFRELLDLTRVTNTIKSRVSFWQSLLNMYNHLELEDRFFAPSSIALFLREKRNGGLAGGLAAPAGVNGVGGLAGGLAAPAGVVNISEETCWGLEEDLDETRAPVGAARPPARPPNYNNLFYLFQAYQPKASIFNPYAIRWILDNILARLMDGGPGRRIFTPVLSWSSYLVAFMHSSSYQEYVGTDVMPSVCKKTEALARYYQTIGYAKASSVTIFCQPSESIGQLQEFQKYESYFDTILLCPPYFDMEVYHEGQQSTTSYPDYQTWLREYWGKTVETGMWSLRKGGVFAFIANDYHTLDGVHYDLPAHLNNAFKNAVGPYVFYLQNRTSPLRVNSKDRTERLFIYKKL